MAKRKKVSVAAALNPFVVQAQQQASLQYDPQTSALLQLVRNAKRDYTDTVSNANQSASAQQSAIQAALPGVAAAYDHARAQNQQVAGIVDSDLAKIGPVTGQSGALQQALQLERSNASDNLSSVQAGLTAGLGQQGVDVTQAQQAARSQAGKDRQRALSDVAQQASALAAQRGTYVATTASDLASAAGSAQQAAAEKAAQIAAQLQVARIGANSRKQAASIGAQNAIDVANIGAQSREDVATINGQNSGAGAAGGRTKSQTYSFQDSVKSAVQAAKNLSGLSPDGVKQVLLNGATAAYEDRPVTNVKGQKVTDSQGVLKTKRVQTRPAVKSATDDPLVAQAAVDIARNGTISRQTRKAMIQAGYDPKDLSFKYQTKQQGKQQDYVAGKVTQGASLLDELIRSLGG